MGDVFDAINRANKERETKGDRPASQSAPLAKPTSSADDVKPALPLDEMKSAASIAQEAPPRNTRLSAPAVTAAIERARADDVQEQEEAKAGEGKDSEPSSLNGYSPQIVVHHDRGSLITEQYRSIRTQILARCRHRRLQTHVITSAAPGEGKSVSSVNLGVVFGELRNQKVLVVEADLRRPCFHRLFARDCQPGLIHLLRGETDNVEKSLHRTVYDNLQFMPAGGSTYTGSTEMLSSPRMAQILDRLKDRYDHIFLDTPPVVSVTDASILGSLCDETLLVVRLHRTPVEVVDRAKRLLRAANCEVTGVILTHMNFYIPQYVYRYV